jgi:DNA mismatch repair protein MutS2
MRLAQSTPPSMRVRSALNINLVVSYHGLHADSRPPRRPSFPHVDKGRASPFVSSASPSQEHLAVIQDESARKIEGTKKKNRKRPKIDRTELSSRHLLEFGNVCKQVASFAYTPAAAEKAYKGRLDIGVTREESMKLADQTRDAMRMLDGDATNFFEGVMDLRKALDAAEKEKAVLHPLVIGAVATSIEATTRLHEVLLQKESPLAELLSVHLSAEVLGDLAITIRSQISVDDGLILSTASESLGEIRALKDENAKSLQEQAEDWSRKMHACGAAERAQVVIRRNRRCIPIKAGRNGELPANSVVLGTSGSQSTMYMEPEPIISLNNFNIELIEAEENEEQAILMSLSKLIAKRAGLLRRTGAAVTRIDLAFARARHALWIGGRLPEFSDDGSIRLVSVMHPLLLQSNLPPLAVPRLPAKRAALSSPGIRSSALDGIDLVPELWEKGGATEKSAAKNGKDSSLHQNDDQKFSEDKIVPISILIPQGKSAVVVSGPNTGGKTASLKTFGILSLMAKSGLALPTKDINAPLCVWFDKVLVDVGDSQSLEQNLSTFSGHMKRISKILESSTEQSLVLLDEIGSGTDPTEGAALALAVLNRLAHGGSAMAYVTTHHAELKENDDPVFLDASVEFDVRTLLPTYKISWGSSGESHALAVAEGLGFDPAVVNRAKDLAVELKIKRELEKETKNAAAVLKESLPEQIALVQSQIDSATRVLHEQEMMLELLKEELKNIESSTASVVDGGDDTADNKAVLNVMSKLKRGSLTAKEADIELRNIADEARRGAIDSLAEVFGDGNQEQEWMPEVGETVAVLTMGGTAATVQAVNSKKRTATVRAGMMVVSDIPLNDLRKLGRKDESTKKPTRPSTAKTTNESQQETKSSYSPAIQTSRNTVDLRGMSAEDARHEVEEAVRRSVSGSVLFVIHGVGTGRVRATVLEALRRDARVTKTEQQEGSNGGCAIVYVD